VDRDDLRHQQLSSLAAIRRSLMYRSYVLL
jgi:hypothetical protein